jgi:ABC-type thiamine transport system ATPase subunit
MWDVIVFNRQEKKVAGALTVIEPNIQDIGFLTGALSASASAGIFPARGGIVVGMENVETRVPLGSMGDGVRRLMALATALSFTKNSYLFIDEIDTGLHYSIMRDMWKLVVSTAIEGGTQVFATTHSWDCIEGLSKLCALEPGFTKSVSIHKIDRAIDRSVLFAGEDVETIVRSHIDPR